MRRRLLLLSFPAMMLVSSAGLAADEPAPAPAKVASAAPATAPAAALDTADVLKRLASDDWKQRQSAERDLVRLGEDALPAIEAMLKSGGAKLDAETRARLEGARKRIGDDRATGPTYVTLHLKDAAPADALAAFSKAARGTLRPYPDNLFEHGPWAKVTLDLDRAPFWDALRQLCDRLGVTPNGWNDGLRLMRAGDDGDGQFDGPGAADGPFLIVANAVNRNQVVRLARDPAAAQVELNEFSVQFSAFAEPKLSVLSCAESVVLESAVDDRGNSLLSPDGPRDDGTYYGGGGNVWTLDAPLQYPARNPGTRIARLRGSVTFTLQSASRTIEIDDPLKAAERSEVIEGMTVILRPLRKREGNANANANANPNPGRGTAGGYGLNVLISDVGAGAQAGNMLQQTLRNRLRVLDAKGNALTSQFLGTARTGGQTEYRLTYVSGQNDEGEPTGEPAKLVWEIPTETKQRKVTFEFKDLPMP